jgi:hypothetical protein
MHSARNARWPAYQSSAGWRCAERFHQTVTYIGLLRLAPQPSLSMALSLSAVAAPSGQWRHHMKSIIGLFLVLASVSPALANKKPEQTCKVKFAFVYIDRLNNTNRGIKPKQLKDVQNKLSKYGNVCYTENEDAADYVFFVHTKPAVYHGAHTYSNTSSHTDSSPVNGTIRDQDGNTSTVSGTIDTTTTTTSTSSEPYQVDYSVFFLDIMVPYTKDSSTEKLYKFCGRSIKRVYITRCTASDMARVNIPSPTSLTRQRSGCTKTISAEIPTVRDFSRLQ